MKITLPLIVFTAMLVSSCSGLPFGAKNENTAPSSNLNTQSPANQTTDPPSSAGAKAEADYLAFALGTIIVQSPKDSDNAQLAWSPYNLIDEDAGTSWQSVPGAVKNQVFVFEMPEKTLLKKFAFDNNATFDNNESKDISIEISDTSATNGFQEVLNTALAKKVGQDLSVAKPVPGRWVRLTVKSNFGGENKMELNEIRGYGEQLTNTAKLENLTGTYEMNSGLGNLHIKQEGSSVVGCYDYRSGILAGGTEGRLLKANLTEVVNGDEKDKETSIGLLSFSTDGKTILGFTRAVDKTEGFDTFWSGTKVSGDVGTCSQFKELNKPNGGESQLTKDLSDDGRAVIYGINFDFNSDVIKNESKPVLDQIVAILKENKEWKMTVEGHTDNIGGGAFNKDLSEKRAGAVKAYLVGKGIESVRLISSGLGMTKPVAPNETEAGRAQNRRVELVKN